MDKISGIIPSSARVTNVDMKDALPTRATLPNADRGMGAVAHIADSQPGSPAWKSKEAKQAAVASEVSNNFFMKAKPVTEELAPTAGKESVLAEGHLQQPEGLFPKGSFIDRNA